ncbi:apolipoprotein N-acyltransferase [Aphanothece hegewaldii CCALA 016]|uniref:Apolipoprotein N-acyltransferase n=1 Tax=Aphanothece hegewaldii CCALA 016 TaxID=2107694 RepID=A0A2T1LWN5_9CHRO|nr:apolipoprotein N-acyltransferase [Aphanothece hegewaldii]PSF36309.1 apolipoprotein N-acyltransferase [Aphanothece hegewaldii CCALA 016]
MNQIILTFFGGLLMGLSPAPNSVFYLAWLALIPLWSNIIFSKNSLKQNLLLGLVWGIGFHGVALFWITGIHPMTWMGVPWLASLLIALFCWIFIMLWGAVLVVVWSFGMTFVKRLCNTNTFKDSLFRIILGVALWCGLEWLWSNTPLWWSSLSYTQSPNNLWILQLSKLSGFSVITASIVAINGLLAESNYYLSRNRSQSYSLLSLALSLLVLLHGLGFYLFQQPLSDTPDKAIKVGIIQGNIPNEIKLYPEGFRKAIEGYTTGYQKLASQGVDVVLTPETALPYFWNDIVQNSSFYQSILQEKIPVWLGAFGVQGNNYTNSLFTVTGDGEIISRFDKVKLVPLGEYIPFEPIFGKIINRLSPLDAHLVSGKTNQIFNTPFGRAIVGICYESAFAEHFRKQTQNGGEFIITAANNAHYSKSMPAQHHAQDIIRAIESDRYIARATNTGYSAFIEPHGRTFWISGINQYQLHFDTIYRRNTETLYVRFGDWLTKLLLISGIVLIVIKKFM